MTFTLNIILRTNAETGESRTGSGGVDQRLGSNSPTQQQQQAGMDPNNAAYLALRNHPETTIRPIGSGAPGSEVMRSPGCTVYFSDEVCQDPSVQSKTPLKMV